MTARSTAQGHAVTIRDEVAANANTATRVGTNLKELADGCVFIEDAGVVGDLVAPGTAAIGTTGRYMDAGTILPATALDACAAPTDVTTLDATASVHGLMPKADKLAWDHSTNGPRSVYDAREDFITANGSSTPATNTVVVFNRAWRTVFAGTGAAITITATNQDKDHWGVVQLDVGTTTTGQCGLFIANQFPITIGSGQTITHYWVVRIPTLSDGTNTYSLRLGLQDVVNGAPNNGIYFEYLSGTSANWRGITNAASTSTVASGGTNVAVAAGAWLLLTITWDGTTASFYVGSVLIGTSTTNIPSASLGEIADMIKSAGTAARTLLMDAEYLHAEWASPRAA